MVDKLLLLLLITLMPIGILVSRQVFAQPKDEAEARAAQIKEVDSLINQLEKKATEPPSEAQVKDEPMIINGIGYASDSGSLRLEGQAPKANTTVMVTVTVLPPKVKIPELEPELDTQVLGQEVVIKAVKPKADGQFIFEYPVPGKRGIVEVQIKQGNAEQLIQFDVENQRQLL